WSPLKLTSPSGQTPASASRKEPGPLSSPLLTVILGLQVAKLAVRYLASSNVITQSSRPEHAPSQPSSIEPALGVAANVITVPYPKVALHVPTAGGPLHVIPAGVLLT